MIYSVIPTDIVFYDDSIQDDRYIKLYNNLTLEMRSGRVERVISTNPKDYLNCASLLGRKL